MAKLQGKVLQDSIKALRVFHEIHDFEYDEFDVGIKVISKNNKKQVMDKHVPIRVTCDKDRQYITIGWQDAGVKNYRSKQLFERYNANFNEMILHEDKDFLEIICDDSDKNLIIQF